MISCANRFASAKMMRRIWRANWTCLGVRMSSNKETVLAFIDRINAHDVQGIIDLMADDYQFVNSSGDRFRDLEFMRQTWESQFQTHPDFQIRVQRIIADDEGVAVFGWAEGTLRAPDGTM